MGSRPYPLSFWDSILGPPSIEWLRPRLGTRNKCREGLGDIGDRISLILSPFTGYTNNEGGVAVRIRLDFGSETLYKNLDWEKVASPKSQETGHKSQVLSRRSDKSEI
jgi:hypothetical protein